MKCQLCKEKQATIHLTELEKGNKKENYFKQTNDGKQILRDMMAQILPEEILNSPKQGFSSPDASWFKGESIEFVKKKLLRKDAELYSILDYTAVNQMLTQHFTGQKNRRLLIWSLLSVQSYLEQNLLTE